MAPPGNQAANRENKHQPIVWEETGLLDSYESDVICIHLSFSPSTEKLIDTRELGWMKRDVILVNTWRGAVLDEVALIQCLKERKIAGAGLDVFAQEPLDKNNPLKELDNAILTSHTTGTNAGMRYTFSGGSGSV